MGDDRLGNALTDDSIDGLFHALSDATRRDILRRCLDQEPSVSALATAYPISLTAIQKHVRVLEDAGLVERRKHGREQLVSTRHDGIEQARQALNSLERTWRDRVLRMEALLAVDSIDGAGQAEPQPQAREGETHGRHGS